ncbi:DUF4129 domain-containing protein [Cytophagaceae bacterium ABcell3]|nr:DUF4129 domain-containing protein [Cytophagaceae bacterium ABcell3]
MRFNINILKNIILGFVLLLALPMSVCAENDNRFFDKEKIEEYRANKQFAYTLDDAPRSPSWLERLLNYIFGDGDFSGMANVGEVLLWVAILALIVFVVFKLLKVDFASLWRSDANVPAINSEEGELPSTPDLQMLLEKAVETQDFRNAVRYYYLIILQELGQRNFIRWAAEKTNRDYLSEIKNPSLKPGFRNVSSVFDHIWYGGFELSEERYKQIDHSFADFLHKLKRSH